MATDTTPQVRAGCYLRISSDPNDKKQGVQRQREDTAALCEIQGWTLADYYEDNDRSASNGKDRPEWRRLLDDIKAGEIDAIAAWDQDRNWRMMSELEDLRKFFASLDRPVKLATTGQGVIDLYSPSGVMYAQLKTLMSEHEIAMMRIRQLRAARQRAQQGKPKWKKAFGYLPDTRRKEDDDGTREINADQKDLIEAAYEAIVKRVEITEIANQWNKAGVYGLSGKPWSTSTLSLFLRSPRNAGLRSHNDVIVLDETGQPVKGTWPALVDEELWRDAQTVLSANRHAPKSVRKHLLTGVMRCGREGCDGRLGGNWVKDSTGGLPGRPKRGEVKQPSGTPRWAIAYECKTCHGVSVRSEPVEQIIKAALTKRMSRADAVKLLRKKTYSAADAALMRAEEKLLIDRLAELNYERAKGKLDGVSYYQMADIINADLAKVERRRQDQERLRLLEDIPLGTDKVADAVDALSDDRLRKVIDLLMVVTIVSTGKNGNKFNPERVQIAWK
jgi:DNA invertase Pin-like site-specific DNA recombinase